MLASIVRAMDSLNRRVGHAVAWLALAIVLVQVSVVVLRHVFAIGFVPLQEAAWALHGVLFMAGAGYALLHDGHVRVDVFYREASARRRALVDLIGALVFLVPLCGLTVWLSWDYVIASWRVLERSGEVGGLPVVFLLKTMIWVFAGLLALQGLALAGRAGLYLAGASADYGAGAAVPGDPDPRGSL